LLERTFGFVGGTLLDNLYGRIGGNLRGALHFETGRWGNVKAAQVKVTAQTKNVKRLTEVGITY
jgi:hypothetical protein